MDGSEYYERNAKLGQKVSCGDHDFDPLLEFWNPLIYPERLNLESSNLAKRWMAVSITKEMQNWVKRGHVGPRDPLLQFWDLLYLQND